jgi:hypothetical protein
MTVREILRAFRPETGGRETDWDAFAARVWKEERAYVDKLKRLSSPRFFLNRFF